MSDMKEKEKARQTRTERELERLGEGSQSSQPQVKPAPKKKKKKPAEKHGIGRDHAAQNKKRLMDDLDARIRAAERAGNTDLVNKYRARKEALESM